MLLCQATPAPVVVIAPDNIKEFFMNASVQLEVFGFVMVDITRKWLLRTLILAINKCVGFHWKASAREKLEDLRVNRRKGTLPVLKQTPKFSDFTDDYLQFYLEAKDAKRASTMETEKYAINQ